MLEHLVHRAIFVDQLGRRFLAHAGDAWDVINGIAHQRLHVDRLRRLVAHFFEQPCLVDHLVGPHVVHVHARREKLTSVLVL